MNNKYLTALLLLLLQFSSYAQVEDEGLFGKGSTKRKKQGFVLAATGVYDFPMADMGKRFGNSFRVGAGLFYKTQNNWMIGPKGEFIFGNKLKEDSLLYIYAVSATGGMIMRNGIRGNLSLFERGYMLGMQVGKVINLNNRKTDNGLLLMTTLGFMQHKIRIVDGDGNYAVFKGDLKKGYDRLANGLFLEQFIGYNNFDKNGFFNFNIGADVVAGFTQGRRNYQYDIMRPDNARRLDVFLGIKLSLYIPMFKRYSEDYYF